MVRVENSTISGTKEVAGFGRDERAVNVTRSLDQISYLVSDKNSRIMLANDLVEVVYLTFAALPDDRYRIHDQQDALEEAVNLLAKDGVETLFARHETVQYYLDEFFGQIREIRFYAADRKNAMWEMMITQSLKKFIKNMNKATNRSVTVTEYLKLTALNESGEADSLCFTIDLTVVEKSLQDVFDHKELQAETVENKTAQAEATYQKRTTFLSHLSPEALEVFVETERIITEVAPLATTPEDEYFLEQIEADYYPHIFGSLTKFEGSVMDFHDKETAVMECIKQFKIIQLGLQKIIDNTVSRNLTYIKSQTDFLRNKVLGEKVLSLTAKEADEEIEASLEEANRIREGLYKKHVAPILEQNKNDHDAAVEKNRAEYEAALVENRAGYDKLTTQQKSDYDKLTTRQKTEYDYKVATKRAENVQQKADFDAQLVQQKSDFDAKLASDQKETVLAYRKELDRRTEAYKKTIRTVKNRHTNEITNLKKEKETLMAKCDELIVQNKRESKRNTSSSSSIADYEYVLAMREADHQKEIAALEEDLLLLSEQYGQETENELKAYRDEIKKLEAYIFEEGYGSIHGQGVINDEDEEDYDEAEDYDALQVSPRKTKTSKQEDLEDEINEARQELERTRSKKPSIWHNGNSYSASGEMLAGSNLAKMEIVGEWDEATKKIESFTLAEVLRAKTADIEKADQARETKRMNSPKDREYKIQQAMKDVELQGYLEEPNRR